MNDNKNYLEIFQNYLKQDNPSGNSLSGIEGLETSPTVDMYRETMSDISNGDVSVLNQYIDALLLINKKTPKLKRKVRNILISNESLQAFRKARKDMIELYPLLAKINNEFDIEFYYELSLKSNPYIYGGTIVDAIGNVVDREPRSNEEIESMLELFINQKDNARLSDWVFEILLFTPEQISEKHMGKYCPLRDELRSWTWDQVFNNEKYRRVVSDKLFKKKELRNLLNSLIEMEMLRKRHAKVVDENKTLKRRVRELEDQVVHEKSEHQSTTRIQNERITELNKQTELLSAKVRDYDLCRRQLSDYIDRYNAQIGINERIVIENDIRISEIKEENEDILKTNLSLETKMKELRLRLDSLESDYNLKSSEVKHLREEAEKKETVARYSLLCELVTGLNDQLYYLTCFYLDLKETGHLEPETVGLFEDTLNAIDNCLSDLGVQKIGVIDQQIMYDASLYSSSDGAVANGEIVKVCGYGWKVNNEIYMKAPVEKGNDQ